MARRSDHTREELRQLIIGATRKLISDSGAANLSARRVAKEIGYTVGTIYQHFENMDSLVDHANALTLQSMYKACSSVRGDTDTKSTLIALAHAFTDFVRAHRNEWTAVIDFKYSEKHEWSEFYDAQISSLLGLIADATGQFYPAAEKEKQMEEIAVLWASLFGIFSLDAKGRLGKNRTLEGMVVQLVNIYLDARAHSAGRP